MSVHLLDVNVLIALMWPAHEAHKSVHQWFLENSGKGWATCPFTEAGFVRIVSNPAFSPDAVTPNEALGLLGANLKNKYHRFWKDEFGVADAVEPFRARLVGHRQVTNAYLLGLSVRKGGALATLDRNLGHLADPNLRKNAITVIRSGGVA